MAAQMVPFEEYTFIIRPISRNDLEVGRIRLIPVANSSIEYITTETLLNVTPQIGRLEIIRDVIAVIDEHEERIIVPAAVIAAITDFEYLSYDSNKGVQIEVDEVNLNGDPTGVTHKVLFSIMNQNNTEKLPNEIKINKINWRGDVTSTQHVALSVYHLEQGSWVCISEEQDFEVAADGMLNTPILISPVEEDTKYKIVAYHYESEEQHEFYFYAPIKPVCGENPIVDKVEWEGRKLYIDCPNILPTIQGKLNLCDWGFGFDYQTKGINIRSSILSSDPDVYGFKCIGDGLNKFLPCIDAYPNRVYTFPYGQDFDNKVGTDIMVPSGNNSIRIIAFNFIIKSIDNNGECTLLKYTDIHNATKKISISRLGNTDEYNFNVGSSGVRWSIMTNDELINRWHTAFLCLLNKNNVGYCRLIIPELTNPLNTGIKQGDYFKYIPKIAVSPINVDRQDFDVTVDYSCNSPAGVKLYIVAYLYQYNDTPDPGLITEQEIPLNVSSGTETLTFHNDFAYALRLGVKVVISGNVNTSSVTINSIKVNNNIETLSDANYDSLYSDNVLQNYISFNWSRLATTAVNVLTTVISGYHNTFNSINDELSANSSPVDFCFGNGNFAISHFICKDGAVDSSFNITDVDANLFMYMDEEAIKTILFGYKLTPQLICTNENLESHIISGEYIEELKYDKVVFLVDGLNNTLLANKQSDELTLKVTTKDVDDYTTTIVLTSFNRLFKNIKELARVPYDINFEADFDGAVLAFKEHYYAKQKRWGGNMGGGVNAELVYFDRGRKCLILEQHGDLYEGKVPAITTAGAIGYGFPVSLNENPVSWPDDKRFAQRNIRVAGLIQSINYHGYGMFDCWFKVPKGMTGLAICLWYFHYQEIYDYDKAWDFWVNTGMHHADGNIYRYDQSIATGSGAVWFVVNNEIDMELGSENTPYRSVMNPNNNASLKWYAPGLSMRQSVGCTTEGNDYGLWMIDWERSKATIEEVINTYGKDPTDERCWIASNRLVWVKIKNTFDEVNVGATVRSCRFNNWVNERWNDGCGAENVAQSGIYNRSEMDVNNRTPLGQLLHNSLGELIGLIEHYYDDGQYHKWSIDWLPTRTRLLIDDELIAICDAFVPFNPMTMLVGCWFPSGNVYDAGPLNGNYGTWAGIHANFDVANMEVKRIKYTPYSEQEAPTTHMRYDCETYAQDGLRELVY